MKSDFILIVDTLNQCFLQSQVSCLFLPILISVIAGFILFYSLSPPNIIRDFTTKYTVKHGKNLPPLFPNGWIPMIESSAVNNSKIISVQLCGEELIVFRGQQGEVFVLDAYCPHLGAKLSSGGFLTQVCNDTCIRCPFHGWTFRANDGLCVQVPYTPNQSAPKGVRIKTWTNVELHGFIYVWFHADGLEPTWRIPNIDYLNSKWFYGGRSEHIFNAIYQDIPENGADISHFTQLHPWSMLMGNNLESIHNNPFLSTIITHKFESSWNACEPPENHKSLMILKVTSFFLNFPLLIMDMNVEQIGPSVVHLYFKSVAGIEGVLIQNVVPVRPFEQKVIHRLYLTSGFLSKLFAKFMLYGESTMLERDICVWRDKKFISKPKFVKEDYPIIKYRKWFTQFYSENSANIHNFDW